MYASPLIVVGLGAFAAQALAGGIDTVVDTTVITITSCGPEVENCPGKTAGLTTSEVTDTSTYCPPTVSTTAPVVPETQPTVAPVAPTTYAVPTISASSVTIQVSELSSTATPVAPVTPASNLSTVASAQPATSASEAPTTSVEAPTTGPVASQFANSTMTAPTLSPSETGILTATGSPSFLTSVTVVPPTSTTSESSSTTSASPKATGAAGHMVVPGVMLGLLGVFAMIFA